MKNKIVVGEEDKGKRLDRFLQEVFPEFSRAYIQNAILNNEIFLMRNGENINKNGRTVKSGEKLKKDDEILCFLEAPKREINLTPEKMMLDIVYEDDDLAVINKPQGLVVHPCISCPDKTLVNGLLYKIKTLSNINGEMRPGIVHRLDKDTCGLIVVAKNDRAHIELAKQIANRTCSRKYLALIKGMFKDSEGVVQTFVGRDKRNRKRMAVLQEGRVAITEYKTIEYFKDYSLIEFTLQTGRTHQIRVHAKHLNHPLVGDLLYGGSNEFGLTGQFLCAYKISFSHPTTQEKMDFEVELPENFKKILKNLKKDVHV